MNLNKAMIIGNITRDPEVRKTPNGQTVASFGVATNRRWTDQAGQKQEQAEYHNIVAWRRLAEIVGQYLKKGSKVYIEGRMQTRSWEDQSGTKRYKTEIVAENLIMLDKKGSVEQGSESPTRSSASNEGAQPEPQSGEPEINVEDIPF
jgi:single-strand DNA-binding protein